MPDVIMENKAAALLALAQRCEAASGPDRELDEAIALAVYPGLSRSGDKWYLSNTHVRIEDYTASLDSALGLAPAGLLFTMTVGLGQACVNVKTGSILNPATREWSGCSKSPALALCCASLRARAALA